MPDGQAVVLGTQSVGLSEPTALVVPNGHAKQGSVDLPVEYVPTGHCWQLSPIRPAAKMGTSRQLLTCGDWQVHKLLSRKKGIKTNAFPES
jgi:hypothetical protein